MQKKPLIVTLAVTLTMLVSAIATAQVAVPPPGLFQLPLNQLQVPEPPTLFEYVKNKPAAIKLGKALFWDMQAGSDGIQACATCHFEAGVDKRMKNTVHPGPDNTFQVRGPNETLIASDFPFHKRQDPDFQSSPIVRDINDVVGSQGVRRNVFTGINPGSAEDSGTPEVDPVFGSFRRVTGRNTPTNINAVFNFSNFWDGRASYFFNGVNPFGPLDQEAGVWFSVNNALEKRQVEIEEASLASQATGPPLDSTEMSYIGRTFPELGRKMLSLTPLGKQMVHPDDSVLGPLSRAVKDPATGKISGLPGLNATYTQMIRDAFQNHLWNNIQQTVTVATVNGPVQFSQMEANFSLFWGLAIQLYEATLVSDQTPFDRFLGTDQSALTDAQQHGLNIFFGAGRCDVCHGATELTNASFAAAGFVTNIEHGLIEQMPVANGDQIIYDNGFNNTAVRPTSENPGRAGNSPFINQLTGQPTPLDFSSLSKLQEAGNMPFAVPRMPAQLPLAIRVANSGGFKVPGLRNVELTEPYFHNGDSLTLLQTVEFYTRGANFPAENADQLDVNIVQLGTLQNSPEKKAFLVEFMKSMTDERVRNESAPFDHPELFVPEGEPETLRRIPAKDANGSAAPAFALTMDSLPVITNKTSLTVSGTKEGGATVEVKVNGGAPFAATANGTAWSATINGFAGGLNTITVIATDVDQNQVTLTTSLSVIFSDGCVSGSCQGGGSVGIADAVRALRIAVGIVTATAADMVRGDVAPLVNGVPNPDGRIDVSDALLILKKAVGLVSF